MIKSQAMTRAEFQEYIDHFNRRDLAAVAGYFAPDVTVEYYDSGLGADTPPRTLRGAQGFLENYRTLFESVKESLELRAFMSTSQHVFAELYTEFHPFKSTAASGGRRGWTKDEPVAMTNWVLYDMLDGKMRRIRIAHFRDHAI